MLEHRRPKIMVAINGPRKQKQDHPAIPLTTDEICQDAKKCLEAGADAIHFHVRDSAGDHTLDPALYRKTLAALHRTTGDHLVYQVTTEAVGRYQPPEQMALVKELKPAAVSLALRELIPTKDYEHEAGEFFNWLGQQSDIWPQYIIYSLEELERFRRLQADEIIPVQHKSVLFVIGNKATSNDSDPAVIDDYLELGIEDLDWWICAFGQNETACALKAAAHGGNIRIGFENNIYLPDGTVAADNSALVKNLILELEKNSKSPIHAKIHTLKQSLFFF